MIRCSCHGLHGCVPVAPSATPRGSARSRSCCRLSPRIAAASANESQRPVRTSISEAISSPTRCGSRSVPSAASWSSSNRLVRSSVSGSRSANSSSTATVKSGTASNDSRELASLSWSPTRCSSPTRESLLRSALWLLRARNERQLAVEDGHLRQERPRGDDREPRRQGAGEGGPVGRGRHRGNDREPEREDAVDERGEKRGGQRDPDGVE